MTKMTVSFAAILLLAGCADIGPENTQLAKAATAKIEEHSAFKTGRWHVQAFGHVVYVSGIVDTWLEYAAIQQYAQATPGVERVVNGTTVEGSRY